MTSLTLAVTGANGFIGRRVVTAALERGYKVRAIVRPESATLLPSHEALAIHEIDLRKLGAIDAVFKEVDVVIHLAAVMSGPHQHRDTLLATDNVLHGIQRSERVHTLCHFSSIAVLDYLNLAPGATVDEQVPLAQKDADLGHYARMKRDEELRVGNWAKTQRCRCVMLRPGIVYGKEGLADAHAGQVPFAVKHDGEVPVVAVDKVVDAVFLALESQAAGFWNLVNDALPTQGQYLEALRAQHCLGRRILPMPWKLHKVIAQCLRPMFTLLRRIPDPLHAGSIAARYTPFRFDNRAAKTTLGWQPNRQLEH